MQFDAPKRTRVEQLRTRPISRKSLLKLPFFDFIRGSMKPYPAHTFGYYSSFYGVSALSKWFTSNGNAVVGMRFPLCFIHYRD